MADPEVKTSGMVGIKGMPAIRCPKPDRMRFRKTGEMLFRTGINYGLKKGGFWGFCVKKVTIKRVWTSIFGRRGRKV